MKKEIDKILLNYTIELLEKYESKLNISKYAMEQDNNKDLDYKIKLLDIDIEEVERTLDMLRQL
nr:hypothetical protein [uncultured Romboutsia sp.]